MSRGSARDADSARVRFDELLRAHHRALHAHLRVVYPAADADGVVNAIFARLWQHLDEVPDHAVRSWLRATARHEVFNQARAERRWYALNDKVVRLQRGRTAVWRDEDAAAELDLVMRAMSGLSADDRQLLLMTALEDLSTDELATILDVRPDAAKARLSRARARLRSAVERHDRSGSKGSDR